MDAAAMAIAVGSSNGSGSSSSSASSSGYGSATTTPTTPGQYEGATATTATIATVAPFYSEALTSLDAQHRQQQQQQHQQQQQQQQQQSHFYHQNYNYGMDAYNYSAYNYNVPSARYEKLAKYSNNNSISSSNINSNSLSNNNIHSNNSKPQAAATPFYAQPPQPQQTIPYEAYKYKLPQQQLLPSQHQHQHQTQPQQYPQLGMGLSVNMGMNMGMGMGMGLGFGMTAAAATTAQKQQHQQQQHQQQQQQQQQLSPLEPSYAAIKPNSRYPNMTPSVYGSPGATVAGAGATVAGAAATVAPGGSNGHAYYDKYAMSLYPPNFATAAPLYSPPEETAYRKPSGNSGNCHWSLDYSNASNCHGAGSAAPAAAVYHHPSTGANSGLPSANNELYYKYDKYATPTAAYGGNPGYQANLTQSYVGRGMWPTANSPENSQPSARQSCCTQGFAPQQNCYYPRSNGYGTTYTAGNTGSSLKLKHPTDLHTNYELPAVQRGSYAYGQPGSGGGGLGGLGAISTATPTFSNTQRYVHPQLAMGLEASVSTAYYNDLNSLDNYGAIRTQPPHPNPTYPPQNQAYPNQASASSLEYQYRKRALSSATLAPTVSANNCYLTQQPNNLGNLEPHVGNYVGYDLHASAAPEALKSQAPSSHSSNIREFLSSWNDDEEELPAISQSVAIVAPTPVATPAQPHPPIQSNFMYETLAPAGPVATAVLDAQVSDLNLPDIIIDHHEKSSVSLGNLAPNVGQVEDSFGSFDVEKELDELRLKKSNPADESDALEEILREPVGTEEVLPPLSLPSPISIPIATELVTQAEASIEFDQGTSNSNESTFEKEYETFIHKIGSDTETELNAQDDSEYREHAKRSKFSKRKRKSTEERDVEAITELQLEDPVSPLTTPISTPKASARDSRKLLARRRRNRIKMLKILEFESPKIKHRFYFRTLKLLRRRFAQFQVREQRLQRLRRQLSLKKERHLPLIKRRSVMQYAAQKEELQSIASLKDLSDSAETSSGRETVIKSIHSVRESLDCPPSKQLEEEESKGPRDLSETEHNSDSNHTQSMQSVELLGSFKGFDDVENTNLSPKAKLRLEEPELRVETETEAEVEVKAIAPISPEQVKQSKQLEIQRWLSNSMEDHSMEKPQAQENQMETAPSVICLSSSSSSSSGTSSSSTGSSSSDDSDSSSSEEMQDMQDKLKNGARSSSNNSTCSGEESDFNELAALQKELSQQSENNLKSELSKIHDDTLQKEKEKVSNNDIEKLKQILESDGDGDEDLEAESKPAVPKLSDLSKIALNSSLNVKCSDLDIIRTPSNSNSKLESQPREMSVEEALAEMYQQIGVASDPEETEARKQLEEESAAAGQDVLINLAEIFDNNSSDLYVVQCDLNENILGVVNGEQSELQQQQLIELLTEPETVEDELFIQTEPQFDGTTPLIHHEEIVPPENCKIFERGQQLLKYLHSKYVQSNISRFYHAQRVLKKYQRYRNRRFSSLSPHSPEFRVQVRAAKSV